MPCHTVSPADVRVVNISTEESGPANTDVSGWLKKTFCSNKTVKMKNTRINSKCTVIHLESITKEIIAITENTVENVVT